MMICIGYCQDNLSHEKEMRYKEKIDIEHQSHVYKTGQNRRNYDAIRFFFHYIRLLSGSRIEFSLASD